jgi:hypothetical protein
VKNATTIGILIFISIFYWREGSYGKNKFTVTDSG